MEKVRGDFHNLYQREDLQPTSLTLATHVDPVQVNDATPSEVYVETSVRQLRQLKIGGHTHLHEENFKQWLLEAYPG